LSLPGAAHALCKDCRDAGRRLALPLQVLWGQMGVVQRCFDPLHEWRQVAENVRGGARPCGHCIPEESPEALLAAVQPCLLQRAMDSA
jgi:haloacetate dehalogenase